jgi:outer membrane immunogenic protein
LRSRLIGLAVLAFAVGASLPAAANGPGGPNRGYQPSNWQGLYVGLHAGYGDAGSDLEGFIGGAQIGYNWQRGLIVYGWEADATFSDISTNFFGIDVSVDWFATARGRVGYLFQPNLLAYATAGLGIYSVSASIGPFTGDDTQSDFVIGLGLEGKYTETTSWRVEYLSFDDGIDVIRAGLNFKLGGY